MGWHIVITEEMRALGLTGNDLLIYALIYGFSQKGQGCFYGNLSYICETCGIARRTAIYILNDLVARGYIDKTETIKNNVKSVCYQCKNCTGVVQKLHRGSAEFAPNNIIDIDINKDTINKERKFNFRTALIGIGVQEDVTDAWLQVRKTKRATNTEIAFKRICEEINKSGRSANDCITIAVENSWQGFKASWIEEKPKRYSSTSSSPKESVLSHNLKVMDQMFGTSLHQQAYGGYEDGQ